MRKFARSRVKALLACAGALSRPFVRALHSHGRLIPGKVLKSEGSHVFFGYYDHTPFSNDGRRVLAVRTDHSLASPLPGSCIDVGYFDLSSEEPSFSKVAESAAWCWQQGCRLSWFPASGGSERIFFNTLDESRYVGRVVSLESGDVVSQTSLPLYDVSRCGRYGLSLNFSRLQRLRPGYGYTSLPDTTEAFRIPPDDGVFLYDFASDHASLIISYETLVAHVEPAAESREMHHYINHLSFSPSATRFLFLYLIADGRRRITRLVVCNRDGSGLKLLNRFGTVSHYAWHGDSKLLVFCTSEKLGRMCYQLFDLDDGSSTIVARELRKDGHPSLVRGGDLMITDTYPNRFRYQMLMVYDIRNERLLSRFPLYRDEKFRGEWRTDLHPRLSPDERLIAVDDEQDGFKAMRVFHVQYD
jgi:hypothetical protein